MYDDRRTFAAQFIDLTAEETVAVLNELAVRTGVPRDKVEQVAFRAFSVASRTYRLVRHNLAEIQEIREEASLIFRMEVGEELGLFHISNLFLFSRLSVGWAFFLFEKWRYIVCRYLLRCYNCSLQPIRNGKIN